MAGGCMCAWVGKPGEAKAKAARGGQTRDTRRGLESVVVVVWSRWAGVGGWLRRWSDRDCSAPRPLRGWNVRLLGCPGCLCVCVLGLPKLLGQRSVLVLVNLFARLRFGNVDAWVPQERRVPTVRTSAAPQPATIHHIGLRTGLHPFQCSAPEIRMTSPTTNLV